MARTKSSNTDAPNFDPLARAYRWMEYLSFGPMLERCRFHFLQQCVHARHALILGDGDGRFTARLFAANPGVQVTAVDASAAMLATLRCRVERISPQASARLQTIHADLRRFTPIEGPYDLVVSHFFLDCLTDEEVDGLIERIAPHLTADATWLISEFTIPGKGWQRPVARLLIRFLYFAFSRITGLRVQQISDYGAALGRHGFYRSEQGQFLARILTAELLKINNL